MKPFILVVISSFIVCSCGSSRMAVNSQESTAGDAAGASPNATSAQTLSTTPVGFSANTNEVVRRGGDTSGRQIHSVQFDTK
jgi:hypothetical protein